MWAGWIYTLTGGHLVVHDGAYGAALHFDDEAGPTWEPKTGPEEELEWADVEEMDAPDQVAPVDWVTAWGQGAPVTEPSGKVAVYQLIAHFLDAEGSPESWADALLRPRGRRRIRVEEWLNGLCGGGVPLQISGGASDLRHKCHCEGSIAR